MTPINLLKAILFAGCAIMSGCERQVSFVEDVQPILLASCIECHDQSAEGQAISGLNLRDYDGLMSGTQFGKVVVPGSSMSSALYLTVANVTAPEIHMPPHHEDKWAQGQGNPLTEDQVETIKDWIDQGALDN